MSEDSLSGFADLMVMSLETMEESDPDWAHVAWSAEHLWEAWRQRHDDLSV